MGNREIQKVRLIADRRFHDRIVADIFENPGCLDTGGLNADTLIWKACEYHYMHGAGHKNNGKYEVFAAPDLVFFYLTDSFNFLILEVKGNILGKSHVEADHQLERGESYFRGFWKAVLVNQVKPALLSELGEFPYTGVFLSLAEVIRESLTYDYTIMPHKTGIYLGKVSGSRATNLLLFTE